MKQTKNKQSKVYWQEFRLNIMNQLNDLKTKKVMQIGYQIDNILCFTLLIPRGVIFI